MLVSYIGSISCQETRVRRVVRRCGVTLRPSQRDRRDFRLLRGPAQSWNRVAPLNGPLTTPPAHPPNFPDSFSCRHSRNRPARDDLESAAELGKPLAHLLLTDPVLAARDMLISRGSPRTGCA